ncbi:hypothetical protein [Myroides odoratus]
MSSFANYDALISSRIEGTISTIDEILQYQADFIRIFNKKT